MKLPLRLKYLGWMLFLLLASNVILIVALLLFNLYEAAFAGGNHEEEIEEFFFMLGVMVLIFPLLLWGAHIVTGHLLRPLEKILNTADTICQGDLNVRIPPINADERLARLAVKINGAFDRYTSALRQLEAFSVDASHQLRTPLAAIRTTAEIAMGAPRSVEAYEETLGDILNQTDKLKQIIDQMLLLAHIEGTGRDQLEAVDLCGETGRWLADFMQAAESMAVDLQLSCSTPVHVHGNPILLREAFVNLLENAMAHTPSGGQIQVSLDLRPGDRVRLCVEDSGLGVPDAERERVFDRFYRSEDSPQGGSGLGLAVVRSIMNLHEGLVYVESSQRLGGAAFVMELPASPATPVES